MGAEFFHADVFNAPQQPDFDDFIRRCVIDVGDDEVPPSACLPDLTPETTLEPSGPSGTVASGSGIFTFSTTETDSTFECRVYRVGTTRGTFGACSGNGTHGVGGLEPGTYTFEARAVDAAGKKDGTPASRTWTVDTTLPSISRFMPTGVGVSPEAHPAVTFSEKMDGGSLEASSNGLPTTFFLEKGTTRVGAKVSYVETQTGEYRAVLSPTKPLRSRVTYTATVTSAATDAAGNALAAETRWTFTIE